MRMHSMGRDNLGLGFDSCVIYVSEGYDVAYNRRTASQPSYVVLRVTWYVKTFRNVNYVC